MSDLTHYAKVRKYLDPDASKPPIAASEAMRLQAALATSTATREVTQEVRNGFRNLVEAVTGAALNDDASLIKVDAVQYVSPRFVVAVTVDPAALSCCKVRTADGLVLDVDSPAATVASLLGVDA